MKAMILAAGRGERMRPLTDDVPKPLLKVAGKMLIEYHLEKLAAAKITDVVINYSWLGEKIVQVLGDGSSYNLTIRYSPEAEALETAGGIINALPLLTDDSDEPFVVINSDIYCDYDILSLPTSSSALAHLVLVENPQHHLQGDFSLSQSGMVTQQGEDKKTFSGIGVYHPRLFKDYAHGKRTLGSVLRLAMDKGQVTGEYYQGLWHDVGTVERLNELDLYLTAN